MQLTFGFEENKINEQLSMCVHVWSNYESGAITTQVGANLLIYCVIDNVTPSMTPNILLQLSNLKPHSELTTHVNVLVIKYLTCINS